MKITITIKDKKDKDYKKLHLFLVENDYDFKEDDGTVINKNEDFYTGGFLGNAKDFEI